ncbi:MAG: dTDP-4-dehydrorhamnose 3,5-epimerase [Bacteroidales bacterium]|nr:dTDP-4-dehydrorhamnose 3,5-epimerase [Bacteroidales bacterium]
MNFIKTLIPEVFIIDPIIHGDARGYFMESFLLDKFQTSILKTDFVQENESCSKYGVLRGLHYQTEPFAQSKLVRVIKGKIVDIALDIRKGSPTFGQHVAIELSGENKRQLFIPRGFAHGFSVLENDTIVQYKTDNLYSPEHERAILWNDPSLKIDWKIPENDILLSEKDKCHPLLEKADLFDYQRNLY